MIRTDRLSYCYTQSAPIHFPDVDVAQGGVVLLTGPSGCGKSTWLALIAGLVRPAAGDLQVAGQALAALGGVAADAWRAKAIGFLPQKLHLSAALTVSQNLAMAQWAAGQPENRRQIAATLDSVGVADLGARKPSQLSGGQAQRVALARAVLLKPKVILADEPTASLDDEAAASAISLLLKTARQYASTLVIATHDARVAPFIPMGAAGVPGFVSLKLSRSTSGAST